MKYKDYKFSRPSESIELTYKQAEMYFEETLSLIENSKYNLFDDEEEVTLEQAKEKYNETNRRLQTFGQAFELYMKYIIHASRLEKNPNITINELWNKWIRGHQMIPLINEKANSTEVLPNFKEIFNASLNSYYGIYGFHNIRDMGIDKPSKAFDPVSMRMLTMFHPQVFELAYHGNQGMVNPNDLREVLMPQVYEGTFTIGDDEIEKIIENNTAIYEKCRYNIEKMTNYDFDEVFRFISFIRFFARMVYLSNNKTKIDYNVAYVHAMASEPIVSRLLEQIRSKEEITQVLDNELLNKDARLLSLVLTDNSITLEYINYLLSISDQLKNPANLFIFLSAKIPIEKIKTCKEKGYNIMLLASPFSLEQIEKFLSIPVIGEFLNDNPEVVRCMITSNQSDIGLTFEDWYKVLSCEALKKDSQSLKNIVFRYREVYGCIYKNKRCNSIFTDEDTFEEEIQNGYRTNFSNDFSNELVQNIEKNIGFLMLNNIDTSNIPVSLSYESIIKTLFFIEQTGIKAFSPSIVFLPFNEVYAVINHMKKSGYDFSSPSFQDDFWKIYDENAAYDMLLHDNYLSDEFMVSNGLHRKKDERYCNIRDGIYIRGYGNNPLPSLK